MFSEFIEFQLNVETNLRNTFLRYHTLSLINPTADKEVIIQTRVVHHQLRFMT